MFIILLLRLAKCCCSPVFYAVVILLGEGGWPSRHNTSTQMTLAEAHTKITRPGSQQDNLEGTTVPPSPLTHVVTAMSHDHRTLGANKPCFCASTFY